MEGLAIAAIESISNNLGKEMKISMILEMVESILSGTFLLKNLIFDSAIPAKANRPMTRMKITFVSSNSHKKERVEVFKASSRI